MARVFLILSCLLFLNSCDDFKIKHHLIGKYFLVSMIGQRDVNLSIELEEDNFLGRIQVVQSYAVDGDSLIFSKAYNRKDSLGYYILQIKKDFNYAKLDKVILGPLDRLKMWNDWISGKNIEFHQVSSLND